LYQGIKEGNKNVHPEMTSRNSVILMGPLMSSMATGQVHKGFLVESSHGKYERMHTDGAYPEATGR
jgi:hypothetical protein